MMHSQGIAMNNILYDFTESGIKFDEPVVMIGGANGKDSAITIKDEEYVIAVDGGANFCRDKGIQPHLVIGDLDSVHNIEYWQTHSTVVYLYDQEYTDFEKTLHYVTAPLYKCYRFMGGSRGDHGLASLHAMLRFVDKTIIIIEEDHILFTPPLIWKGVFNTGQWISIFPLSPFKVIASSGLKWSMCNQYFGMGTRVSISNEICDREISMSFNMPGAVVVMHIDNLDDVIRGLKKNTS